MKKILFALCLTLSLVIAVSASADSLRLAGTWDPALGQYITGLGFAGIVGGTLWDNGSPSSTQLMCLNGNKTATFGATYDGTIYQLSTLSGNLNDFTVQAYQRAALLLRTAVGQTASIITDIQYAVWKVFGYDADGPGGNRGDNWYDTVINLTPGYLAGLNYVGVKIFVPTNSAYQMFMTVPGANVPSVPIPPTVYLLGAGLLGLYGIRRRFKKVKNNI